VIGVSDIAGIHIRCFNLLQFSVGIGNPKQYR
jgi:hypothetical protein